MKIAIIGRTEFLYKTAEFLLDNGYDIPLIVTAKEAPEYTKTSKDFEELAKRIGAKFLYAPKFTDKEIKFLKDLVHSIGNKCIGVSVNYPTIIPQEVIDIYHYGILNAHGGDLPRYKGNACQAWAILKGEEKIALCIHKMTGGELDSGDIIEKKYYAIDLKTKITDIYKAFENDIPHLFLSAIEKLEKDPNYFLEKQDNSKSLRCYPLFPEDGRIDWKEENVKILRKINAFNKPYSGAFCYFKDVKMIIWDAEIYEDNENYCAIPGQISQILDNGEVVVITGKGKLKIKLVEYEGFIGKPGEIIKSIRTRLK